MAENPGNHKSHQRKTGQILAVPQASTLIRDLANDFIRKDYPGLPDGRKSRPLFVFPSRRNCRDFRRALMKVSGSRAIVQPDVLAWGDLDQFPLLEIDPEYVQISSKWDNLFKLMVILASKMPDSASGHMPVLLEHARNILPLLEEWYSHDLDQGELKRIIPAELAAHFQENLHLFSHGLSSFPCQYLRSFREKKILDALLNLKHPVPLFLITDAPMNPCVSDFLITSSLRPDVRIYLAGLDPEQCCEGLKPYHPQYGFRKFLDAAGVSVEDIPLFPGESDRPAVNDPVVVRQRFFSRVLNDDNLGRIPVDDILEGGSFDSVSLVECRTIHEEAGVIAVILREAMSVEGRSAALVTPDRNLASLVQIHLRRWGVEIDDSAGEFFFSTAAGVFLSLLVKCVFTNYAPIPLLSLLKHPFCALGFFPADVRKATRIFEKTVLRQPQSSFASPVNPEDRQEKESVDGILERLYAATADLRQLVTLSRVCMGDFLGALVNAAKKIAQTPEHTGDQVLFGKEIGANIQRELEDLEKACRILPPMDPGFIQSFFQSSLGNVRIRKTYGYDEGIFIFGTIQSQLQDVDCVVLGGLNAGTWPSDEPIDLLLSQEMRRQCGLPTAAHQAGAAARLFANLSGIREMIMTRSVNAGGGSISMPSPWIQRLQVVLRSGNAEHIVHPKRPWIQWLEMIDHPESVEPAPRPQPCPPVKSRPRELSVSDVERLMQDPYTIYARKVLGLKECPLLEPETGNFLFGTLVHRVCERFYVHQNMDMDGLIRLGQECFSPWKERDPVFYGIFWPRFESVAEWVFAQYLAEKEMIVQSWTEVRGFYDFSAPAGNFRLTAIADRLDLLEDNTLRIVDYKTGVLPGVKEVINGSRPQLLLEALIASRGSFAGVPRKKVSSIEYWQLGKNQEGRERLSIRENLDSLVDNIFIHLCELVHHYDSPNSFYTPSWRGIPGSPYGILARRGEWA